MPVLYRRHTPRATRAPLVALLGSLLIASSAAALYGPQLSPRFTAIGTERFFEPDDGAPIPIEIDARGDFVLGAEASHEAASQAIRAWSAIPDTSSQFVDAGLTEDIARTCPGPSKIIFNDPDGILPPPTIDPDVPGQCRGVIAWAVTYKSSFESKTFAARTFNRTRCGFVVVNDGWEGCSNWTPCNLAEALTHELGHLLGLAHSSERDDEPNPDLRDAAMYFRAHFDGRCASVRSDDEAGARFLYPLEPPLTITTHSPLPDAFDGWSYDTALAVAGGTAPYTWSHVRGTADGLLVMPSGHLTGTPRRLGDLFVVARAQDAQGNRHDKILEVRVLPSLATPTAVETPTSTPPPSFTPSATSSPTSHPSPTPEATPSPAPSATIFASPTPSPTAGSTIACVGDCDRDGIVSVDEIVTLVNIAMGLLPLDRCTTGDTDFDGLITVDEILRSVTIALLGCQTLDSETS